jgi:signal transduction histidine kinase
MWLVLGVPTTVRRLLAARVVGATIAAVLALSVASWVIGDIARNHALGKLHAEIGLVTLQADTRQRAALEWEAIGRRRIDPALHRQFAASAVKLKADFLELRRGVDNAVAIARIEQANTSHDRAVALELAALQRHQISLALKIDAQATDPAAGALDDKLTALGGKLQSDSRRAARLASIIGWMKALVAALAIALLVRQAIRSRARGAKAEAETEALSELNRRLLEVDWIKDEFVATVSHELRTPLTSIRGYLEIMRDEEEGLSEEGRGFLAIIDRNSARLLALVTDLLFIAQAEADRFELELSLFCPQELVDDAIASSQPLADAQQITLLADVEELAPVVGDRARIAQLLDNLVSNALKFTPPSGRVDVRLHRDAEGCTVLEVADTGIGIHKTEQSRLFERFFRTTTATKNAIAGTGLGLSIVKLTAEAHGGIASVESDEGIGTRFRVVLPLPAELPIPAAA